MLHIPTNPQFTGGIDRSVSSRLAPPSSFYDLNGVRQSQSQVGFLETVPRFADTQFSTGVTIDGGTESVNAKIVGVLTFQEPIASRTVYLTDTTVREQAGTLVQLFRQTTVPAAVTINTHCRLVINNVSSLNITLGSTVHVIIDTATSFKWSKNGGGLSGSTPITAGGISIDSGNATVYFLTTTGFVVNDTWNWTRQDNFFTGFAVYIRPPSSVQYGTTLFFTGPDSQVYTYANATTANYVISAGYRPFYAAYLTIFDDHLFCGGYAIAQGHLYILAPETSTWACSDKSDLHDFFSTDTNEADTGLLPVLQDAGVTGSIILGVAVINQNLYILTSHGIFYTPALGLPIVFSFQLYHSFPVSLVANSTAASFFPVVASLNYIYIVTERGPWRFDGVTFHFIGAKVQALFLTNELPNTLTSMLTVYNSKQHELSWKVGSVLYTYQEAIDAFYRRDIDFSLGAYCLGVEAGVLVIGGANVTVHKEDVAFTSTPQMNLGTGASHSVPKVILHALTGSHVGLVKELSAVYLSAEVGTAGAQYSSGANVQVQLTWYLSNIGQPVTETVVASAVWINTNADGSISFPRLSYRAINLALTLNGLSSSKPIGRIQIAGLLSELPSSRSTTTR